MKKLTDEELKKLEKVFEDRLLKAEEKCDEIVKEMTDEIDEYIESGECDKDIDEALKPKTWVGRIFEKFVNKYF